jgi:hypothetical protein
MRHTSVGMTLFLCVFSTRLYAHSLTLTGGVDNFMYGQDAVDTAGAFSLPSTALVINAGMSGDFSTFSSYGIHFESDPVLRYLVSGNMVFNLWAFRLGMGAFVSMFSSFGEEYVPGVSGSLGLAVPGGLSVDVEYGQSVVLDSSTPDNVNLNYGKLEASAWFPYMLCRLVVHRKSYTMMPAETYTIKDSLLRYQVSLDFFSKYSIFQLTLGGGYETLERAIEPMPRSAASAQSPADEVSTAFIFFNTATKLSSSIEILLNGEVPFSPAVTNLFFKVVAGFRITMPDF